MKKNYRFSKDGRELTTKKWKVVLTEKKGHMHVQIKGRGFKGRYSKKCLTSVHSRLTVFERKHLAFVLLHMAINREHLDINYANVFISVWGD